MGNSQNLEISQTNLERAEKQLLSYSGIPFDQFTISNVPVGEDGQYIRTLQVGDRQNEKLVLIHGYGGSGPMFYKIMKPLVQKFHLILIDIIGMGGSSRPEFKHIKDPTDADNFFINYFEAWRVSMGNLTEFFLAGHSFGAYLAGNYACRYPQHIKKLLMLSPIGINTMPEDFKLSDMGSHEHKGPSPPLKKFLMSAFRKGWSPYGMLRKTGKTMGRKLLGEYVRKEMGHLPQEERRAIRNYLYQIFMRKGSTEYALYVCFKFIYPVNSLSAKDKLLNPDFPLPVSFFYGDQDWTDNLAGQEVVRQNRFAWSQSHVYQIQGSDSLMLNYNPQQFASLIIDDASGKWDKDSFLVSRDEEQGEERQFKPYLEDSSYFVE